MASKDTIIKQVEAAYALRDKPSGESSTLAVADVAKGASDIEVASIGSIIDGMTLRLGSGELNELVVVSGAPASNVITLEATTLFAHVIGEVVVEQEAHKLQEPTDAGVRIGWQGETVDAFVATQRLVYATLNGYVASRLSFELPGSSLYNFCVAMGADFTTVNGSGTSAAPREFTFDGNEFGGEANQTLVVIGTTLDGSYRRVELYGADYDYSGISLALARGQLTPMPIVATGHATAIYTTNASWIADAVTTYTAAKGHMFDALTSAGVMVDTSGGASETVVSGGSAGTNTVTVSSGTSFTAGDWVRFGTGSVVEFHQIESIATDALTMRSKFKKSQVAGVAAVESTPTPFAGVGQAGATLAIGGSVEQLRSAISRTSIGTRPGRAEATIGIPVQELSLASFAYVLGIAQGEVANNRLPVTGANLGAVSLDGVYLEGTYLDGSTFRVTGWGCSSDLSNIETLFANSGDPSVLPMLVKPSVVQLLNWT